MDWNLPGFSVHGVSQARILEWVAISFSGGEGVFLTRGLNPHLLLCKWILCHWATRETHGRRTEQWLPGAGRNGGMLFNEHSVSYACRVRSRDPWKETASVNKPVLWDCATCRHVGGHAPLRYSRSYHNIANNYPQKSILLRGYYLRTRSYSKKKRKGKEFSPPVRVSRRSGAISAGSGWGFAPRLALVLVSEEGEWSGWAWICVDTVGRVSPGSPSLSRLITHMGVTVISLGSWEFNFTTHMPSFCKTKDQSKLLFSSVLLS